MGTVKRIIGISDIARHFEVSVVAVHKWVRENKIPANDLLLGKNIKLWSWNVINEIEKLRKDGIK